MADEIRVTDGSDVPRDVPVTRPEPPTMPPEEIEDPEVARAEIQATRARMSETINEIEGVLVRRKERIQDRLDILSPVRENPLPSAGIALGAGLLLGLLTGGGEEEERDEESGDWHDWNGPAYTAATAAVGEARYGDRDDGYWRRRAETWESRARRLRDIAHRQEEEIRYLREKWGEQRAEAFEREEWERQRREESDGSDTMHELRSTIEDLRETVVSGVTNFLTNAVNDLVRPSSGSAISRG